MGGFCLSNRLSWYARIMNKYLRVPEKIVDLHRLTISQASSMLDALCRDRHRHVRIITGKGIHSASGPVLRDFVKEYLSAKGVRYSQSKIHDGGEGALEVFFS